MAERGGDLIGARRLFGEARNLAPPGFESAWLIHNHLGNVLNALGDRKAALTHYHRCRDQLDGKTPPRKAAVVLGNIGVVYALDGDLEQALAWFELAAMQYERTTPVAGTATNLGNIGKLYCLLDDPDRGIPMLATAIRMMGEMGYLDGQMQEYTKLGECMEHLGNTEGAIEAYRQALTLAHPLELRRGEMLARAALARLLDDPVEAAEHERIRAHLSEELGQKVSAPT
ncbi:MAG TPA: tetratricopeptide repeat protein [Myxococcota bacterium]|nr:tetratricopeptide repeat protein [Myxococcota bacterium]